MVFSLVNPLLSLWVSYGSQVPSRQWGAQYRHDIAAESLLQEQAGAAFVPTVTLG